MKVKPGDAVAQTGPEAWPELYAECIPFDLPADLRVGHQSDLSQSDDDSG
jgi:hypothetical protein